MFWLYFAANPTSVGQTATAASAQSAMRPCAQLVTVVTRNPPPTLDTQTRPSPRSVAKRAEARVTRSPILTPVQRIPEATTSAAIVSAAMSPYLACLSEDGDHSFALWDEEAGFSYFSANFERVTGLTTDECTGHEWIHRVHPLQQYNVNEAILAALSGHDGQCLVQLCRLTQDASERWVMMDIKATTTERPFVMVLMRDMSAQKSSEFALKKAQNALALSESSRAAFLSSMSHELRTPLNAIMGFSEMMLSGIFGPINNPTYSEYLNHIHDSGATLLGKIDDLLDIASMNADGLALDETAFQVGDMLSEAMAIHTRHAFTRQQRITIDCAEGIELFADRAKLICATSHLISNALRHSADGANITLRVRLNPDDGLILSVHDTGEGISTRQLAIIRDAFAADEAYFNIECGGIGLGLSLTKELAARHEGRVMIDSIRHRGTVVSVILPPARVTSGMPKRKRTAIHDNRYEIV